MIGAILSDVLMIAFLAILITGNARRAKLKGLNPLFWGFNTLLIYFVFKIIGGCFVVLTFCRDVIDLHNYAFMDEKAKLAMQQQLVHVLTDRPLITLTVELFAFGGYLLVRYILERKPNKKEPEIHWMDKIGGE